VPYKDKDIRNAKLRERRAKLRAEGKWKYVYREANINHSLKRRYGIF
jgi:hypothetical protein